MVSDIRYITVQNSLMHGFTGCYYIVLSYKVTSYMLIKSSDMLNKNTWGVKKCEAKKNQQLKALISNKAKKSVNESAT